MRCPACAELLPHDRGRWPEHAALCTGNSVEEYMKKFAAVAESIARMVQSGNFSHSPGCLHEPDEDHIRCRDCDAELPA